MDHCVHPVLLRSILLQASILRSSLTRSSHRCLVLPLGRLFFGFHFVTVNISSPNVSGPSYSLTFEIGFVKKSIISSLFDLISYTPSLFHFGPNIIRRIFLSNIINLFSLDFVDAHAPHA